MVDYMLVSLLLLARSVLTSPLHDYVKLADPSFSAVAKSATEFRLTSQTWQGHAWTHDISWNVPRQRTSSDTAILVVTGDRVEPTDGRYAKRLADTSGLDVFTLFQVPNQPLWGQREDALIAYSFGQFLGSKDNTWPLLLPMVKSAVKAMDAIQQLAGAKAPKRFVVTGASKRGWTTYLVGALSDPRVAGIAPAVFNNLKFESQIAHQKNLWGKYSEMIADYERAGLLEVMKTPRGKELVRIVDPYEYRGRMTVPKLIITGSNDRYWATDALNLYLQDFKGPTSVFVAPNRGHDTDGLEIGCLAAFARQTAGGKALPQLVGNLLSNGSGLTWRAEGPVAQRVWVATSTTNDFRDATWSAIPLEAKDRTWQAPRHEAKMMAFIEANFRVGGRDFSLSTPPFKL